MIYIIARAWQGGKFEAIEAYRTEDRAREEAGKKISISGEPFNIIIFSVRLIEE